MKKSIIIVALIFIFSLIIYYIYSLKPPTIDKSQADLILYWGNGCPHCEVVKDYISENNLDSKFKIIQKEVYYDKDNQKDLEITVALCPDIDKSKGIGVPLGFDVKNQTCLLGDTPIIEWLKK